MDVQTLRNYTRAQMDIDDTDLPDAILNVYLQEAFDRTMARSNEWPKTETVWSVAILPGASRATLPPDCNRPTISSVIHSVEGYRLVQVAQEQAESNWLVTRTMATSPLYYSLWGDQLYAWPPIDLEDPLSLYVRGYRQPVWSNNAAEIPDLDPRLHATLAYFALSLAYAQQEDDVLEAAYLARWNRDLAEQMKAIFEAPRHRPLVMHGGAPVGNIPGYTVYLPPPGP